MWRFSASRGSMIVRSFYLLLVALCASVVENDPIFEKEIISQQFKQIYSNFEAEKYTTPLGARAELLCSTFRELCDTQSESLTFVEEQKFYPNLFFSHPLTHLVRDPIGRYRELTVDLFGYHPFAHISAGARHGNGLIDINATKDNLRNIGASEFTCYKGDNERVIVLKYPRDLERAKDMLIKVQHCWVHALMSNYGNDLVKVDKLGTFGLLYLGSKVCKSFPAEKGAPFTGDHVNSASSDRQNIGIHREEEAQKTLLHEAIHMFIKFEGVDYRDSRLGFGKVEETLCETLATIGNCAIKKDLTVSQCLYDEVGFSLIQSAKILLHFGYEKYANFKVRLADPNIVKSNQAILEYYLYKTACLMNLEDFLSVSPKAIELSEFIHVQLHSQGFEAAMQNALDNVKNLDPTAYAHLLSTGRMTLHG